MLEVRDGLWTVQFKGTLMGRTDTERRLPAGLPWQDVAPRDVKSYLRWVEMDIHYVEPGQDDDEGHIRLPEGGYFYHVVHHTIAYHASPPVAGCPWRGVPTRAESAASNLLPCRECGVPLLWEPSLIEPDYEDLLVDPGMLVDVEPVRHDLYRVATAAELVRRVTGTRLTMPASLLLEIVMKHELGGDIAAIFGKKVVQ